MFRTTFWIVITFAVSIAGCGTSGERELGNRQNCTGSVSGALVGQFRCAGSLANVNGWETLTITTTTEAANAIVMSLDFSRQAGAWGPGTYEAADLANILGPAPTELTVRPAAATGPSFSAHGGPNPVPGTRIHLVLSSIDPAPAPSGPDIPFSKTHGTLDADLKNPDDPNAVETVSVHVEF